MLEPAVGSDRPCLESGFKRHFSDGMRHEVGVPRSTVPALGDLAVKVQIVVHAVARAPKLGHV